MPPSNFFFQIGCFLTGSRTTMPPSADTRTFTGSVERPMRTFGPGGACRTAPAAAAEAAGGAARPGAERRARSERAGVGGGDDAGSLLPRPADRHAEMLRLHRAGCAERAERPGERLHDLPGQPLLKLQPPRQRVH